MLDCILTHAELIERINELGQTRRLIGPVKRVEAECTPPVRYEYKAVLRAEQLSLEFNYCLYGPKAALLPPRETLFEFHRQDGHFHAVPTFENRPAALLGVHPCDLHALRTLDLVFEQGETDEHYAVRRRNLFVVGVDCAAPCAEGVFCADLDTNRIEIGYDVMLFPLERPRGNAAGVYGAHLATNAGREWLATAGHQPDVRDERLFRTYLEAKQRAFPRALKAVAGDIPGVLERSYDSLLWEATAKRCYSCGSCNLVCPTCYCFDIQDENDLPIDSGRRARLWDGCMLRDFAAVAGGHNFRSSAAQRLRHRIYRKSKWIGEATGLQGCVGCARCDRACTAEISIREILNQLSEEDSDARR